MTKLKSNESRCWEEGCRVAVEGKGGEHEGGGVLDEGFSSETIVTFRFRTSDLWSSEQHLSPMSDRPHQLGTHLGNHFAHSLREIR